ncbi:efflux RND transporter periplasmic adaptor subunit [Aestuariicella hydrocarbonica]|uniref:Efflux RND transporter periplasmic adaptor subunit n=2 Tax=Pseudomaricurvus hydrocarbonicus TaxID=1470433 RepID=A0A9E5MPV2_9GAMM|nr:efflux RND transporter periplasmic adaptor subunit [Aestuariicella hydrocarbonica]
MEVKRKQLLTAAAVLGGFLLLAIVIANNGPSPKRHTAPAKPLIKVNSQVVQPTEFQFKLSSFGSVQPRTQSLLVSQVNGVIIEVNPIFRDGGFFNKGDVLVQIDDRDYQAAAKVAKSELLQAQLSLEEEKARSHQAQKDWQRLGDGEPASDLVLRKPQLAAAQAQLFSAQANFEKAQLDLERTRIRAPYNGRVKSAMVDLGQFVNSNSQLAEIFATDVVEIRLPLKNSELAMINLPENYRGLAVSPEEYPDVMIESDLGEHQQWQGKIVRTEAAIDENSHQLYVVAQIQDPFAVAQSDKTPLKIGQYVTARIDGKTVKNALVVPASSVYQGSYLYVIENGALQRRNVALSFQTSEQAVISQGLTPGSEVIVSPLGQVTSGTLVSVMQQKPESDTSDVSPTLQAANGNSQHNAAGEQP